MKIDWENDGEPNAQGEYVARIDLEDKSGVQRFVGTSHKDVADKLMKAQANATKKIRELTANLAPVQMQERPTFERQPLSADERVQTARDLNDATKAPEAIRRVVESELGAPLEVVRKKLSEQEDQEFATNSRAAAQEFVDETPEYDQTNPHNGNLMTQYMILHQMDPCVLDNYRLAYGELLASGLLVPKATPQTETKPDEEEEGQNPGGLPNRQPVTTRPRGTIASTGIRNGDSGAARGTREPQTKYTIADIEKMSTADYDFKFKNEKGFKELVDKLYAPAAAR